MASFLDPCNDSGSPSISKTEDNLSNSDGPLLKRSLGKSSNAISSENLSGIKPSLSNQSSRMSCQDDLSRSFDSTKKRYCLWALTFLLAIVGLGNLLLSITIIAVLRVSQGMEAMEVIPNEELVKFYGRTDLDRVCIEGGVCQGYGNEPVEFSGDGAGVQLTVRNRHYDTPRANFHVLQNGTSVSSVEAFEIKDSSAGTSFFSTDFPNFGLPSGVGKLAVNLAETHRVVSPVNSSLSFESNRQVTLNGAESTKMESKTVVWMADNEVCVRSNSSIVLDTKKGVFLDAMRIPLAPGYVANGRTDIGQFKVCVCMPQGKLFRVPVPSDGVTRVNCARVSTSSANDPCL